MHESRFARLRRRLARFLDARVGRAAYAGVRVVKTDIAGRGPGHVDFDQDGAGEDVGDGEEHV